MGKPSSSDSRQHKGATATKFSYYLFKLIMCFRHCWDVIINKLFSCYYDSKRENLPKIKNPIVLESASSLARKIRNRKVTSEEVVQAFIDRIKEVNPIINAIVDNRFEDALKEAKQVDLDIASGKLQQDDFLKKPFLGVPFTTKETAAATGLSWTYGLVARKGKKATFDSDCVAAVKNTGAILLGNSNVPQLDLWQETSNPLYGLTKNPYNTTRNVGGSTGGEGSILAACGSPMGIGTDIGGSIRLPAFMCGVFGHKTSWDTISLRGVHFRTGEEKTILTVGPLTRYAEDLPPLVKALTGPKADLLKLDMPVNIKELKVYYIEDPKDPLMSPISEEMHSVLLKAVKHFEQVGNEKPQELTFENLKYQYELWKYWLSLETKDFNNDINDRQGAVSAVPEILKHCFGLGDFTTPTVANIINVRFLKPPDSTWATETTKSLREAILSKLDDNSVLLYPSAPFPASYHHASLFRFYNFDCFAVWSALRFPVTQVPMGLGKEGLPLGLQVVAAPHQDRLGLAVAKELENAFGGYVPPVMVSDK